MTTSIMQPSSLGRPGQHPGANQLTGGFAYGVITYEKRRIRGTQC